jgi:sugar lactone lactonase YvrE
MKTNRFLFRFLSFVVVIGLLLSSAAPVLAQDGGPGSPTETPTQEQPTSIPTDATPALTAEPAAAAAPVSTETPASPAPLERWTISGKVTGAADSPLAGVTVADNQGHAAQTGPDGSYALAGLEPGVYTITPALPGMLLIPYYRVVKVTAADLTGVDFYQRIGPAPTVSDESPAVSRPGPLAGSQPQPAPAAPPSSGEIGAQSAFSLGEPGLAYRYLQTLGQSEVPYTVETGAGITHINGPRGLFAGRGPDDKLLVAEGEARRVLRFAGATADLTLGTAGAAYTDPDGKVFNYPQDMAVDGEGNIWVTDQQRLVEYTSGGDFLRMYPSFDQNPWDAGDTNERFNDPRGLDYLNGRLYVADRGNNRVQVFDPSKFGPGEDPYLGTIWGFNSPRAVWAVQKDLIYVVDSGNNRIRHCWVGNLDKPDCYTSFGMDWGEAGSDLNHLNFPTGIAIDGYTAYISDGYNYRVLKCNRQSDGNINNCQHFAGAPGEPGTDNDHFGFPMDVAVNPGNHNVYVSDLTNSRVQVFKDDSSYASTLGVSGVPYLTDTAHFNRPSGLAISGDFLYVLEKDGQRLLKVNRTTLATTTVAGEAGVGGSDANHFGSPFRDGAEGNPAVDASGRIFVPDSVNHRIKIYLSGGSLFGQIGESAVAGSDNNHFNNPASVAIGPDGFIYVADRDNQRIQVFSSDQVWVATLGETGISGGDAAHFNWPNGVAVDSSNNVFIADTNNQRVMKCVRSGSLAWNCTPFAGVTGTPGQDFPYLNQPNTVAVDGDGWVYILDNENYRIQVFSPNGAYWTTLTGDWGASSGNLRTPLSGLAVSSDKKVYLADSGNHRIQVFERGVTGWSQLNLDGFGEASTYFVNTLEYGPDDTLYTGDFNSLGATVRSWNGGSSFTTLNNRGFGISGNVAIDDLLINGNYLYASTWNGSWVSPGPAQIWRAPLDNLNNWENFSPPTDNQDREIYRMFVFHNVLYAGSATYADKGVTINRAGRIYAYDFGAPTPHWQTAYQLPGSDGMVTSFAEVGNYLYASAWSNGIDKGMVYRCLSTANCAGGVGWEKVIDPGFGDSNLKIIAALAFFNGYLYAGTTDANIVGTIWRCPFTGLNTDCDAQADWTRVISDGFGDSNNLQVRAMHVMSGWLYAFTHNESDGLQIWRCNGGTRDCSSTGEWDEFLQERGFGASTNIAAYSDADVADRNGQLTVGTINWATGGQLWRMNANSFSISGHVINAPAGVTLTLEPGGLTQVTGSDGSFTFSAVDPGAYTLTPTKTGYTFTPPNRQFTLSGPLPNQDFTATYPILLTAPTNGEGGVPLTALLDWEPASVAGVDRYEVQIALNDTFTTGLKTVLVAVSQATFAKLVAGTTYFWRVRYCTNTTGICTGSDFGVAPPSPTWSFKTLVAAQVPVLNAPANAAKLPNLRPTFTWDTGRPPAHHYRLQVSQSSAFLTLDVDEYIYGSTHYAMPADLTPTRMYYWRVQALSDAGVSLGWSLVRTFTTLPAAPLLNSPANNEPVDRLNTEFDWSDPYHAGAYHIQIARSTSFTPVLKDAVTTSTHFVMPAALPADSWLYWRVQAKGVAGVYGPWSEIYTFATPVPPAAPVLTGPATKSVVPCGNNAPSTLFAWTASPLSNIHLQWSTEPSFTWGVVRDEWQNDWRRSNYERRLDPNDFLWCNQLFYWRAQAERNVMGYNQVGPWSASRIITAQPNRPDLNKPENDEHLKGIQTYLEWKYPDDWNGVTFQVELTRCTNPGCTTTTPVRTLNTTTSYTNQVYAENLPIDSTILWRVRARGSGGFYGLWSDIRKFYTPNTALAAPGLVLPLNNALINTMPVITFVWTAVPGANVDYQLEVDTRSTFDSGNTWVYFTDETSFSTNGDDKYFQPGIYYWRVLARKDKEAEGAWSTPRQYHTLGAVEGRIWNALDGGGLGDVNLKLTGVPDMGTDPDGYYKFWNVPAGSKTITITSQTLDGNTYLAQTRPVTVVNAANAGVSTGLVRKPEASTYRIVLTWKQNPAFNLDAHLWLLPPASPYHVYKQNPGGPHAQLNPFDSDGQYTGGPEVITIDALETGAYRFGVNLASPTSATVLRTTAARVEVYKDNSTTPMTGGVFTVPTSGVGLWWYVFDLSSTGTLTKKNLIQSASPASYPDYSISGKITHPAGSEYSAATLRVDETGLDYPTASPRGLYTIPGLAPGAYTVTPRGMGYTFNPSSTAIDIIDANVTGKNFEARPDFGQAGGKITAVRVMGHYAYLAVGNRLVVLDVQDKAHPNKIADKSFAPAPIEDLAVAGDYAYLAQGFDKLQVIRISDPASPAYAGGFYSNDPLRRVAVQGNYVYLAARSIASDRDTLLTVNFSDKHNPRQTSSFGLDYPIEQLLAWNGSLYAAAGDWCLRSLTLSNPGQPSQTSQQCNGARIETVAAANGIVYFGGQQYGNESQARFTAWNTDNGNRWDRDITCQLNYLQAGQNTLYAACADRGLRVINANEPWNMQERGGYDGLAAYHHAAGLALQDSSIFMIDDRGAFQSMDVSNPNNPTPLTPGSWSSGDSALGIAAATIGSNKYSFAAMGLQGLAIYNVNDPTNPTLVYPAAYPPADWAAPINDVFVQHIGSKYFALLANDKNELSVFDVSIPAAPVAVPYTGRPDIQGLSVTAGTFGSTVYAFVARGEAGVDIFSIAANGAASYQGTFDTDGFATQVFIGPDQEVYVADGANGLVVLDISSPASPTQKGHYGQDSKNGPWDGQAFVSSVHVAEIDGTTLAFLAAGRAGLYVINVSDPTQPSFVTQFGQGWAWVTNVFVKGNRAYLATSNLTLFVLNVTDVKYGNLPWAAWDGSSSSVRDIFVGDGATEPLIYTAEDQNGLRFMNFDDPSIVP